MKRFLTRLLFIVITMMVLYPFVTLALGNFFPSFFKSIKHTKGAYGHLWTRLREVEKENHVDVLILGSSTAYRGIDTRAFDSLNIKAFNLGSSAQTPLQSAFLLDRYGKQLHPSLIIWDINPYTFHNSGYESYVDICSNMGADFKLVNMLIKMKEVEGINTFTFVKMEELFTSYFNFKEAGRKREDTYVPGGFVERDLEVFDGNYEVTPITLEFRSYQKEAFEQALAVLSKTGTKVVLVMPPVYKKTYQSFLNTSEINDYFDHIKNTWHLEAFYNFNEIALPGLDESNHYYDDYHLNQEGVKVYNKHLIKLLIDNKSI